MASDCIVLNACLLLIKCSQAVQAIYGRYTAMGSILRGGNKGSIPHTFQYTLVASVKLYEQHL